jgi:hypothetical protein
MNDAPVNVSSLLLMLVFVLLALLGLLRIMK